MADPVAHIRRFRPGLTALRRDLHAHPELGCQEERTSDIIARELAAWGAVDFAYMLQARPGAYVWLGHGGGPGARPRHNSGYDFNDEVIPPGAGYLAALAQESLPRRTTFQGGNR